MPERHVPGRPGADQVALDVRDRIALVFGQAGVDPDLFPVALHPQRLHAEKRRPGLPCHLLDCEAKSSRLRPQRQLNLSDAGRMVGPSIKDAGHTAKAFDYRVRDFQQAPRIRVRQYRLDGTAEIDDLSAECDPSNIGQDPNLFPPILHNRNSGQVPMLCTEELEFDRGDVRLRIQCGCRVKPAPLHPGSLADGYARSRQQRRRTARPGTVQAFQDSPPRALQLHCDLVGPLGRRPVRHFEIGGNEVALHDRGESSRDDARWYPEREQ